MRETAQAVPRTDTVREDAGKLNVLQVFIPDVKAQPLPDLETECQAAQCLAQGVDGLRETLLRLPTTWVLILDAVKRKRLKTLFEASSCLPLPPLEPIRFLLHSLATDWTHATDCQTRDLLSTRAVAVLSPFPLPAVSSSQPQKSYGVRSRRSVLVFLPTNAVRSWLR